MAAAPFTPEQIKVIEAMIAKAVAQASRVVVSRRGLAEHVDAVSRVTVQGVPTYDPRPRA